MRLTSTTSSFLGPEFTPPAVKKLITITCLISVFSALITPAFHTLFEMYGPEEWLSLSWYGMQNYYLWQPVSYLFLYPASSGGITLSYLFGLALNMYALWIIGSDLSERLQKSFLRLYLITGLVAGLGTLILMPLVGQYRMLAGPAPAILALLTLWAMLHPRLQILLFFVFPVQARWLVAGILGMIFLTSLSQLDILSLSFYLGGAACGYFYGLLAWNLQSPFSVTHGFDNWVTKIANSLSKKFGAIQPKGKIIDFRTGQEVIDDDNFVDEMLVKISKHGEDSLSWREKRRMRKISEKKSKKQNKK